MAIGKATTRTAVVKTYSAPAVGICRSVGGENDRIACRPHGEKRSVNTEWQGDQAVCQQKDAGIQQAIGNGDKAPGPDNLVKEVKPARKPESQ